MLIISCQDPCQNVGSISFIVKGRFSGEYEQVSAVFPPANLILQPGRWGEGEKEPLSVSPQTTAQHLQPLAGQHWQELEDPRDKAPPPLVS